MKFITRQIRANDAARAWNAQHWGSKDPHKIDIGENLSSLGKTPSPDDVDETIGNGAWTTVPFCDECEKDSDLVVQLGEDPDYESNTAFICLECLRSALNGATVSGGV